MRGFDSIVLVVLAASLLSCRESNQPPQGQSPGSASLGSDEEAVISTLLHDYSQPALSSLIASSAPESIQDVQLDYGTVNSLFTTEDYLRGLAYLELEWMDAEKGTTVRNEQITQALQALYIANKNPLDVRRVGEVATIPVNDLNESIVAFGKDGPKRFWEQFGDAYPNHSGFATTTRVGFSDDKTVAAVYFSCTMGSSVGIGCVHLLQRAHGKWTLVGRWEKWGWKS